MGKGGPAPAGGGGGKGKKGSVDESARRQRRIRHEVWTPLGVEQHKDVKCKTGTLVTYEQLEQIDPKLFEKDPNMVSAELVKAKKADKFSMKSLEKWAPKRFQENGFVDEGDLIWCAMPD